ncbi:MAG: SAM-dependent chlorinase/fluorinase [Pseudomonadales bacterium]|nr:SAM-dependent chlorinase/fluorinase [Pseudomonadales bacterium]
MPKAASRSLTIILSSLLFAVSAQASNDSNNNQVEKGALIIQADFSGLVMTGVAYSVDKNLSIFNLRPLIPLYDIKAASQSLAYNAQTWPAGTVFVSVVDPGVGTDRKSVVLKTKNGLYFVSPDNGSLSDPVKEYGIDALREIDEKVNRISGSERYHTFHGRDVYSYVGARLAAGVISFEEVGPLMAPEVVHLDVLSSGLVDGVLRGFVSGGTGRLGNITFSIDQHLFDEGKPVYGEQYDVVIRQSAEIAFEQTVPYSRSFADVPLGEVLLFIDSSGNLSLAVNQGNFAKKFSVSSGKEWMVELRKQGAR